MTLDELKQYCSSEFTNINRVQDDLFTVYSSEKTEYSIAEQAAIATFTMNIYTGIENILKQMLIYDKLDIENAPKWHEKVLTKAGEIGILPPDLFQVLSKYLSFRNFFIYSYVFNVNMEDMKILVDEIKDMTQKTRTEIEEYLQTF